VEGWHSLRRDSLSRLHTLESLLDDPEMDPHDGLAAYLDAKASLAAAFMVLLRERLSEGPEVFASVCRQVSDQLRVAYSGLLPDRYLGVLGFGAVHVNLYCYLARRVEHAVPVSVLRVLTGDAIHTERRVRDLRDLGLDVRATRDGGTDAYILMNASPDVHEGARRLAVRNVRGDRQLSATDRERLLAVVGPSS